MAPNSSAAGKKKNVEDVEDVVVEDTGEYPKHMYGKGRQERVVKDAEEQAKWEAKGFKAEPSEAHLHDLGVEV